MQSEVSLGSHPCVFMLMSGNATNTLHMRTQHHYVRKSQLNQGNISMIITIGEIRPRRRHSHWIGCVYWQTRCGCRTREKLHRGQRRDRRRGMCSCSHSTLLRMENVVDLYLFTILRPGWENCSHCNQHGKWIPEVWMCAHAAPSFFLSTSSLFGILSWQHAVCDSHRPPFSLRAAAPTLKSLGCATLTEL